MKPTAFLLFVLVVVGVRPAGAELPARYFRLLVSGADQVESRLDAEPLADLQTLEGQEGRRQWNHFPFAILAPAVLYARRHPGNPRYHDPRMLRLAIRIGHLLAQENEKGRFTRSKMRNNYSRSELEDA